MSIVEYIQQNEEIYIGTTKVNYFYMPPVTQSEKLVIIFSGFNGKEGQGKSPTYNYVKVFNQIDAHRLFILDSYEGHPCYYLGKNQQIDYELATMSLVYDQMKKLNIRRSNVVTTGSSKGGTAALYFALKYNLGTTVVGGFQSYVGSYLREVNFYARERVLKLITGGVNDSHEKYLNDYFHYFFENVKYNNTNIYVHGGSGDPHYLNHVVPVLNIFNRRNIPYSLDVKEYNSHAEIGEHFSQFLFETIPVVTNTLYINQVDIKYENNHLICTPIFPNGSHFESGVKYAYYIYSDKSKEPIKKFGYSNNESIQYKILEKGDYRVKVFVMNSNHKTSKMTRYITI